MAPCLAASLRTCLEDVSDPRRHPLTSMLFLALTAVIGGADTWVEMEEFERWLCLPHGIPFHDTFGQVSALLDPELLEAGFARRVQTLHGLPTGQAVDLETQPETPVWAEGQRQRGGPEPSQYAGQQGMAAPCSTTSSLSGRQTLRMFSGPDPPVRRGLRCVLAHP